MGMSGSIRRTDWKPGRSTASRKTSPLFASPQRTVPPGPGAHLSGPGSLFLIVGTAKVFCKLPKSVPSPRTFTSYFIPLERKSRLGATRSNFHE
jgi:hypothetical protein